MLLARAIRTSILAVGLGLGLGACAATSDDEADARGDALADVGATDVKRQTVGNCWLYGATAWLEALHAKATGETLDLSESYLTYWYWFGQLADASAAGAPMTKLKESAYWEVGSELVAARGLRREADFLPDGSFGWAGLSPTRRAMKAVNDALASPSSPLRRAMDAKDRVAVRRAYDALWGVPADVVADLEAVFGPDGARTFASPGFRLASGSRVIAPARVAVRSIDPGSGALATLTAADVVAGGRAAWSTRTVTVDVAGDALARRAFERPVQRALHAGLAVPIVWMVDMNAREETGAFRLARLREKGPGKTGAHLSLVVDYEVSGVPGYGKLPAGVLETRPAALEAALSDAARVDFFRIKNSWGTFPSNPLEIVYRYKDDLPFGTNDLEGDYLFRPDANGEAVYSSVVLPPGL